MNGSTISPIFQLQCKCIPLLTDLEFFNNSHYSLLKYKVSKDIELL